MEEQNLFASFQKALPSNSAPIVEASIGALGNLPHMQDWKPKILNLADAWPLISWGFPLTFLNNSTFDRLRADIGLAISEKGAPNTADLSEVNAVALAVALGANGAENVKCTETRTPDFLIAWDDAIVEFEVTRASQKEAHVVRRSHSHNVAMALQVLKRPFDLIVHLSDLLTQSELTNLLDAASTLDLSEEAESINRWHIRSLSVMREPGALLVAGQKDEFPNWWSEDSVTSCVISQIVDAQGAAVANPQVRVNFGVPIKGYVNPVQRKAEFPQASGNVPFVIAIDVGELPGAFNEFRRSIPHYFSFWSQVSAILVFRDNFTAPFEKIGWLMELIVNPFAASPLPVSVIEKMQPETGTVEVWANLRI